MKKITLFILLLCVFTNCTKDSYKTEAPTNYDYYYPSEVATITAKQIGEGTGTLDPKGIAIANDKLYICNGDVLEIFNAKTLAYIKTIKEYTKGSITVPLTRLSSVSIDNGRIYIGSIDSRIFIIDENTNQGINTIGDGNWWSTFVHVFGMTVKDGLLFVKEKESSIKVFETAQISSTSNPLMTPIAKLSTIQGWDEIYSMDVANGNLIVAGIETKGYLYYNIADIKKNAVNSLTNPIAPTTTTPFTSTKPIGVNFSMNWAVTSENDGNSNLLRIYPKEDFISKTYKSIASFSDINGATPFGKILGIVQFDNRIFFADNGNQKIRIIKLDKATIAEQK